jgi:hypothetical protein
MVNSQVLPALHDIARQQATDWQQSVVQTGRTAPLFLVQNSPVLLHIPIWIVDDPN